LPNDVRRRRAVTGLGVLLVVSVLSVLTACGGDDDAAGADGATTTTTAAAAAGSTTTAAVVPGATTTTTAAPAAESDGVPDPCVLVAPPQLVVLLGADPGAPTPSAYDPEQRKICAYASGMILAVEVADNYDAAIDIMRDETGERSVREVSGVGSAAVWQDIGEGVGQFVALGDDYFVGVTLPAGGQEVGRTVAEAMLAAL
jgi:hypothetical protein